MNTHKRRYKTYNNDGTLNTSVHKSHVTLDDLKNYYTVLCLREKRSLNSTYKFQKINQHASKFFSL